MIQIEDLLEKKMAPSNVSIVPGDIINVSLAGSVFVIGEVARPGEFVLRNGRNVSSTQALALGGGFSRDANKKKCLVIRVHNDGIKEEIPINLQGVLDGSVADVAMQANDILFVPATKLKRGVNRTLEAAIGIVSGRLIYGF
jgi:polysaccharide export outer membrane protein